MGGGKVGGEAKQETNKTIRFWHATGAGQEQGWLFLTRPDVTRPHGKLDDTIQPLASQPLGHSQLEQLHAVLETLLVGLLFPGTPVVHAEHARA